METIFSFTLYFTLAIVLSLSLSSFIVLLPNYKYYKGVYKSLKFRKFYILKDHVYSHKFGDIDDGFVWFINDNDFRLKKGIYLHSAFYTYFDLYSLYWLSKYKRWMRQNIDLKTIEKY